MTSPTGMSFLTQLSNDAANRFVADTEHIALNADEQDAETIIKDMRGMAYAIGFEEGYRAAEATKDADYDALDTRVQELLSINERLVGQLAANQWREIDPEALPECPCLVVDIGFPNDIEVTKKLVKQYGKVYRTYMDYNGENTEMVTHWRPLPEGPK